MDEIIPYIILILVLLVLELIQIVWAKIKIVSYRDCMKLIIYKIKEE